MITVAVESERERGYRVMAFPKPTWGARGVVRLVWEVGVEGTESVTDESMLRDDASKAIIRRMYNQTEKETHKNRSRHHSPSEPYSNQYLLEHRRWVLSHSRCGNSRWRERSLAELLLWGSRWRTTYGRSDDRLVR